MTETLEELSYEQEEDGVLVRKQLERVILTRGSWATVMFLFQDLDRATGSYRAPRMAVVRFQKLRGAYRKHASFNIASQAQARELTDVLERWYPKMREASPLAPDDDASDGDDGTFEG
jgi:hypothetical protein